MKMHVIKTHEANQRLDRFLIEREYCASRRHCENIIREGNVLVNELRTKPSLTLKTGDTVSILDTPTPRDTLIPWKEASIPILFHNRHCLIIDKPAGIAMHPSSFDQSETIANWLIAHFPSIGTVGENPLRPGIVHRLDKHTSGVCVIALTQEAFLELKNLFKKRLVRKTYLALVHGQLKSKEGVLSSALARSIAGRKQSIVDSRLRIRGTIRQAETLYQVLCHYQNFDLIEATPKTGRMHQIRVHLASIGHPLIGDALYGTKLTRRIDQSLNIPKGRHFLHAKRLQFELFGENIDTISPLPNDFETLLSTLNAAI